MPRSISRRKAEGVVYTPAAMAKVIVEMTLGRMLNERARDSAAYRDHLKTIRVLDPACGEGVFLEAAFEVLFAEHLRLGADPKSAARQIVSKNLYGVDVDALSVATTRRLLGAKTVATPPS